MSHISITKACQKEDTQLNGRKVVVVDTPGFFNTSHPQKDIAAEVRNCVKFCSPGPHVILHVIRPGCFSQEEQGAAQLIKEIFGLKAKNYIILLFTHKEDLEGTSLKNFIAVCNKNLKEYAAECGNRFLAFNNWAKGAEREAQVTELMTMIDRLVETNGDAPCYTEEMMKFNKRHKFWTFFKGTGRSCPPFLVSGTGSASDTQEPSMALAEDVMEIPALGRPFQLGMLYDCRKDALIPGITLWDHCSLQKDLTIKPQPKTESEILASDAIDDKASALDISANLKASFLGGLVEVGGSAKYLQDTKKSKQQARVTVQYKATTRYEQLTMSHLGIQNISHPAIFEQGMATHVVTAILYGAQAFFVFDREVSSTEIVKSIKGKLQATIKKMISVGGKAAVELNKEETENILKFSCKFHGDFSLERNPVTVQDAVQVYATLPKMLGECGEKAVPVRVWLFPLTKLDTKAAKMVREISLALIFDVEKVLEELDEIQMQSNDLANNPVAESFPEIKEKIQQFKDLLKQHRQTFQKQLARVLPSIRGGGQEEGTLVDLLTSVNQSPFNGRRLREFLDTKKREINFVKSYLTILEDIDVISSQNMLEEIVLDSSNGYVVIFIFTSLHEEEPFLFTLQDWLWEQFMPGSAKSTRSTPGMKKGMAWFEDQERTQKARQAAKSIQDFFSANQSNETFRFVVASLPDVETPGASIYLYEDGKLVSKNFELPSKPLPFLITEVRHNSIRLKFQPAEYGKAAISSYLVEYKVAGKENWKTVRTEDTRETFLLNDLLPNTKYQIQYAACCKLGLSKFSDTTAPAKTLPSSPPEKEFHLQGERRAEVEGPRHRKTGPREEEQESCIPIPPWPEDDEVELRIILVGNPEDRESSRWKTIMRNDCFVSKMEPQRRPRREETLWKGREVPIVYTASDLTDPASWSAYFARFKEVMKGGQPGPFAVIHVARLFCHESDETVYRKYIKYVFQSKAHRNLIVLFNRTMALGGETLENFVSVQNVTTKKYLTEWHDQFEALKCDEENEGKAYVVDLIHTIDDLVEKNPEARVTREKPK
ncbi:uncharacterized protein LOC107293061 [Protobothrops mucrosquamatus]|uniref:uncharacterized protein LOC107293061 n=1 Tax=Protobothrops mucrosquamatus TaxID=103944 RepID=UPI0010FAE4A5|nr:uncharacterized protein LOC107293061 [Protobothrops mucrosquamatus]